MESFGIPCIDSYVHIYNIMHIQYYDVTDSNGNCSILLNLMHNIHNNYSFLWQQIVAEFNRVVEPNVHPS